METFKSLILEWSQYRVWINTAVILLIPIVIAVVAIAIGRIVRGRPKPSLDEVLANAFRSSSRRR